MAQHEGNWLAHDRGNRVAQHSGNYVAQDHGNSTSHLVNISKAWIRIRKAAAVEDVRLHDLRRTTGSWLAQKGNSLHLIGKVLNHRSTDTTKIYARFGQDHVREALEVHGNDVASYLTDQKQIAFDRLN